MLTTYRPSLRAEPFFRASARPLRVLTVSALQTALADATVRQVGDPQSGYAFEVGMSRRSHASALDEITAGVGRFGLTFADAFISEWVTETVRYAVAGFLTAAGGTAFRTRNPVTLGAAGGAGSVVGGILGSLVRREVGRYIAHLDSWTGVWSVEPLALPPTAEFRFGYT